MTRPLWEASEHDPDASHDERGRRDGTVTNRDAIEHRPNPDERGTRLATALVVLGAVTIGLAVAFDFPASQFWNALLAGVVLCATGAYNYVRRSNEAFGSAGAAAFAALVGLWLVASPALVGPEPGGAATADSGAWIGVVGLLAFAIGSYSAVTVRKRRRAAEARSTAVYDRRGQ
ncbi:hypothetical protein [Halopiger djelfimassiliensis]|uniref:hypothetical protein n=1 Tax=Halopiger djelfimassiliensis TaxID=1293047 RepID=UPI000677AA22|nr:hypothetical protein [Halopiger djelfimassiliensis]